MEAQRMDIDNQNPTVSFVLPYTETLGKDVVDLYNEASPRKLHPWQEQLIYDICAVKDGLYVHVKFGFSVSRRNGKSEVVIAIMLYALVHGLKILYTAQSTDTCHEIYELRVLPLVEALAEKHEEIEIAQNSKALGKEHIYLRGGGLWKRGGMLEFRTRTTTGRLGTGFDMLIIDEAQEYTPAQEAALRYVTTDARNPQTIMLGTPPTAKSAGVVFPRYRDEVLSGDGIDSGWAEWGIQDEVEDVTDPKWWYLANPSLGLRDTFTERNIRAEIGKPQSADQKLDIEIQRLGLWLKYSQKSAISQKEWDVLETKLPQLQGKLYVGIKFGHSTPSTTMAIAVKTKDGKVYTEVIDNRPTRAGVEWIMAFLKKADIAGVVVDGQSGIKILESEMKAARLKEPITLSTAEYIEANQLFEQALDAGILCHGNQSSMTQCIANCKKRAIGTSGWGYETSDPYCDIGLLDATLLAYYGSQTIKPPKARVIKY